MGKATLNPMFSNVSGAVAKPKKDSEGHSCGEYVVLTHRTAPSTNPACQRVYIKTADAYKRSTPVSADELSHRATFGAIARAVNTRLHNQQQYAQDVTAFKAQTRYKTLRQYVWNVCTNEYYQNQG